MHHQKNLNLIPSSHYSPSSKIPFKKTARFALSLLTSSIPIAITIFTVDTLTHYAQAGGMGGKGGIGVSGNASGGMVGMVII
ncbi:MAG: hypothetical protein K0M45_00860 [Candidatus Paracaedibacteraceae bacterium]|nr:hypothetical protein [Candidatus Paracaedibacteraceae bacterium]